MYQALYRKYRPKTLDDVVGQEVIVKIIKNSISNSKISHAYIFCGPRGTGKTTTAKLLAKYINCLSLKDGCCCDCCQNCKEINNNQSIDILEIDAASNNGVEEIRELRSKVNLIPNSLKYKVYIIDEVHMLSVGAFNALLKTLEEPPKNVVFILATTDVQKVPLTILSRCQILSFNKIGEENIKENIINICLKEKISITEEAANEIARCADGGMRDAIGILDKIISYGNRTIVLEDVALVNGLLSLSEIEKFLDDIFENNIEIVIKKINIFDSQGKSFEKLIEDMIEILVEELHNEYIQGKHSKYNQEEIISLLELLNMTIFNMKSVNSSKILLEIELIKLMKKSKIISREIIYDKTDEVKNIKNVIKAQDDELKKIRINNAFFGASKETLKELNTKISILSTYKYEDKYAKAVNIILDGQIRVASNEYIIFTFPYSSIVENANNNINEISNILERILSKKFKLVFLTEAEWQTEKNQYIINKKKGINYAFLDEKSEETLAVNKKKSKPIGQEDSEVVDLLGADLVEIK